MKRSTKNHHLPGSALLTVMEGMSALSSHKTAAVQHKISYSHKFLLLIKKIPESFFKLISLDPEGFLNRYSILHHDSDPNSV